MWTEHNRELRLDEWEADDPSFLEKMSVYACIMDIRDDPRRSDIGGELQGAIPEMWIVDAPGTRTVSILYAVYPDTREIDYIKIWTDRDAKPSTRPR